MTTRHLIPGVTALLAVVLLTLTACGGDSDSQIASLDQNKSDPSAGAAPTSTADLEKELDAYVECLRKQGVDLPDPTVDADGQISLGQPAPGQVIDRDKVTAAMKVCGDLPAGLTGNLSQQNTAEMQDAALEFAKCMREEGVDVPDPDLSKLGQGGGVFGADFDPDDPKTQAAIEACQHVWTEAGVNPRGGQTGGGSN